MDGQVEWGGGRRGKVLHRSKPQCRSLGDSLRSVYCLSVIKRTLAEDPCDGVAPLHG